MAKYIFSASEAESMAKSKAITLPQLLPSLVKSAQSLARPPISNFHVGAVGLSSDGRIFFGANIEFPGLPLHHSIHAEQFLITNLAAHGGGPKLVYMAVSAAPCGHCRQFLQELRGVSHTQIVITDHFQQNPDYKPISSFLPHPFGPYDLLDQQTPLILEKHNHQLTFKDADDAVQDPPNGNLSNGCSESVIKSLKNLPLDLEAERESHAPYTVLLDQETSPPVLEKHDAFQDPSILTKNGNLSNGYCELMIKNKDKLKIMALEAASDSHAPYSGCPSGVALMDCEGKVYKGSYMESAAYNPSMMPVQAALVAYMVGGGGGYERIVAAVVVEKEGACVRQEDTARLMLTHISPKSTCKNANSAPSPAPAMAPTRPQDGNPKTKDKPLDPFELPFPDIMGMAPESPDEKKDDSKDEKKKDEKKGNSKDEKKKNGKKDDSKDDKKNDEKKDDSKDKKKKDDKKGDSKDEKKKDEKKGDSKDEKKKDGEKDDSKDGKKGDSKDGKKGDSKDKKKKDEKKGDSKDAKKKDEKKGDSKDEKKKDREKGDSKDGKKGDSKDEEKGDSKDEQDDSNDEKGGDVATRVAAKMKKIEKKINEFNASLKQQMGNPGTSPGSHECVLECDEVLGAAIDDIQKTLDSLDNQNLVKAKFDVSAVSTNVDTCNDCFDEMVGGDPEAKKLTDWVQKTTGDALESLQKANS
ncbi:hypothetical protein QVD17_26519 [Tagetes erecta]|uniref:cytidine deaminase n=1 Tax=Tagetes erecta TaxID=13708 RepID=A0AAD8NQE3_TARER|nr:hypothetical protein QVD17_26519 [Tagetes erecta]